MSFSVQTQPQAAPPPAAGSPEDRATEFKAVDGSVGEHFNGYTLMVEAYAIIWLVLMGWLVVVWRQQANLTSRVTSLEAAITRAERKMAGGKASAKPSTVTEKDTKAKAEDKTKDKDKTKAKDEKDTSEDESAAAETEESA